MKTEIISQYEEAFSQFLNTSFATTFWKGRTALYAILKALNIGPGDEVILPAFTCVVVPNAVIHAGAIPVYVDIKPNTYNIDPQAVSEKITSKTRALIVQHTFGIPAELDSLVDIAQRHNLLVIEDCAHSLGSTYNNKLLGTFGAAAFFSSQWSKPYTTGLGGIAVTASASMEKQLKSIQGRFMEPPTQQVSKLRLQYFLYQQLFSPRLYWMALSTLHKLSAYNLFIGSSSKAELEGIVPFDLAWKMSSYQAKIGFQQIKKIHHNLSHRRQLTEFYEKNLCDRGWANPESPRNGTTEFLRYPLRVANKWDLLESARKAKIEIGSWFESVLHPIANSLEVYGYRNGQCPIAERTAKEIINLPLHQRVCIEDAERTIEFIFNKAKKPKR